MKVKITTSFRNKLNYQVNYIAKDKPGAARIFKDRVIRKVKELGNMPFKNRKSIFFEDENIRDLIIQGYIIVYRVRKDSEVIEIFGLTKYEENPFK